jgi:hypothetical protein
LENLKGRGHMGVGDSIKIDIKGIVCVYIGFNWIRILTSRGSCEHGNDPWGFIRGGEFREQMSNCHLFKRDSASWS